MDEMVMAQINDMRDHSLCRLYLSLRRHGDTELADLLAQEIRRRGMPLPDTR